MMLRTLTLSAAISALMVSGALAQANPPPAKMDNPAAAQPAAAAKDAKFIPAQGADKFVFSKFKGTNVLGPDNEKVGDVTDMLFDQNGKTHALIVGVGGFLGIGEKNVAIDMSAFQFVPADTGSSGMTASSNNDPTNMKLKVSWTKEQLKDAPDFQYYKPPARTTQGPGASPTTGMAPRPTAPAPTQR
jgi:sporulation protein YlmC with PRC-barrel domain